MFDADTLLVMLHDRAVEPERAIVEAVLLRAALEQISDELMNLELNIDHATPHRRTELQAAAHAFGHAHDVVRHAVDHVEAAMTNTTGDAMTTYLHGHRP